MANTIFYDTVEQAIEITNDTNYGFYGMVFGPEDVALRVSLEIKTGQLQINDGLEDTSRHLEDISNQEVAERVNIDSMNTLKSRLFLVTIYVKIKLKIMVLSSR